MKKTSPKGQVGEEGDGQEDGGDSAADVGDEGEDGGLRTAGDGLSGEVLRDPSRKQVRGFFSSMGGNFIENEKLHGNDCPPTSKIAKLVKWLQLQSVSLAVLFLTKQPSEFQPPASSVGRNPTCIVSFFFSPFQFEGKISKNILLFIVKSQKTQEATKFACGLGEKKKCVNL